MSPYLVVVLASCSALLGMILGTLLLQFTLFRDPIKKANRRWERSEAGREVRRWLENEGRR